MVIAAVGETFTARLAVAVVAITAVGDTSAARLAVAFGPVLRYPDTDIFVLTLADEAPFRSLHDRLNASRIQFAPIPFAFNAHDYMPITGKIHQPPSSHQIWDAPGAAFILFAPRMFDYHPLAVPAPYNHSSVDCDEIIYYASGNFMSRRGIEEKSSHT